jgi:guanyl-specific ribonuclease Sa
MIRSLLSSFPLTLPAFIGILLLQSSYAQTTQADIDRICGTKMEVSSAPVSKYRSADRQVQAENAKVEECIQRLLTAEKQQNELDAVPVGGKYPGASVNGVPLRKCSHGGVCQGQLLDAMRTSSY